MVLYTSENHDCKINANIGARGMAILTAAGFLADYQIEANARKAAKREKLDEFLSQREQEKREEALLT